MSVFKKDSVVAEYPAYNVVKRQPTSAGHINLTADDQLTNASHLGSWSVGSAASYALQYNECPIESFNDCVAQGHKTHWINHDATCISDSPTAKMKLLEIDLDAKYMFEGKVFTIVKAHNNNYDFKVAE